MAVFGRNKNEKAVQGAKESINIIGERSTFVGVLEAESAVEAYGKVSCPEGANSLVIKSQSTVLVAHCATVRGDIHGTDICLEGNVEGNIYANGKVHLVKGCQLKGNIESLSLVIEDGVIFVGNVSTKVAGIQPDSYKDTLE